MCGLIAAFECASTAHLTTRMGAALKRMFRRGPDGEGIWATEGVALGHRRLAIIDLDSRASQPMHSVCGRYVIVFNGEIYNHASLRADLEGTGSVFRTNSDTEVLLTLFAAKGAAMLPLLRGMFALVIWDKEARSAFAARDPYGIKPLYLAQSANGLVLGSQVKALLATGLISAEPDPIGQAGFWLLGSVPEPHTWFRRIRSVPAGHCLWVENGKVRATSRWADIGDAWRLAPTSGRLNVQDCRERVREALLSSVAAHLVSDVPVGVFLSGGIDSGALAGLMVEAGAHSLQGVTLAYEEFAGTPNDEAPVAAKLARHYGICHHVRLITYQEFTKDLPRILDAMDQPSIDGINSWYASKAVAELGLKVVVSGVGGDELFQGYSSFRQLPALVAGWGTLSRAPGTQWLANQICGWHARNTGNGRWRYAPKWAATIGGAWWLRRGLFGPQDLPLLMGPDLADQVLEQFSAEEWVGQMSGELPRDFRLALGQIESTTYLRNQLLRDSDWASMDHSVELRTPLVDASLLREVQPLLGAFRQFPGKRLLAEAPARRLPEEVITRPKTGFAIPIQRWLLQMNRGTTGRGPSQSWAQEVAREYNRALR